MCYLKVHIYTRFDRVKLLTDEQKLAAAHEFEGTLPEFGRWLNQLTPHAHYVHEVHLVWLRGLLPTNSRYTTTVRYPWYMYVLAWHIN